MNVKTSITHHRVMPFPAVTVCNANGYKNSSIERLKSELGADAHGMYSQIKGSLMCSIKPISHQKLCSCGVIT